MLKALELIGFKSFAEKTRFDFPRGITVVVGPNGSGKSNIVDAIKWVLGEQSVKSLRGKEMVDVIFNGSAARRTLNAAEATLTFDNSDGRLAMDTPEVHVTRRVYRSGEGEYLINRQPSRLRDIRDLFAGTGVATEAYSIIEQGKVDILLQSSPRDRRVIFEEAAGISRFKAKKTEALRRLERVDQNLLRLGDIVEEVEGRLRTVRMQATKARRYKEYADRLQALRTQVALVDWRAGGARLAEIEREAAAMRADAATASAEIAAAELSALEIEGQVATCDEQLRASEERLAATRERVAALESSIDHQRSLLRDWEQQAARLRLQWASFTHCAEGIADQWQATSTAVVEAETRHRQLGSQLADEERAVTAVAAQIDQLRVENEHHRATHLVQTRTAASLDIEIVGLRSRLAQAQDDRERYHNRLEELAAQQVVTQEELAELNARHTRQRSVAEALAQDSAALQGRIEELDAQARQRREQLHSWRERLRGATERAALLAELDAKLDGVHDGVREVLARCRTAAESSDGDSSYASIRGMLADLIQVELRLAPLIESALGERAQYLVVADDEVFFAHLASGNERFAGRVGFLPLRLVRGLPAGRDLSGRPGVLGRADRFVETPAEYVPLIRQLLGETWIVDSLQVALSLSQTAVPTAQFVTVAGELLTPDGTLILGPKQSGTGFVSRRSELRSLQGQIAQWTSLASEIEAHLGSLERQATELNEQQQQLARSRQEAVDALAELRLHVHAASQRLQQIEQQHRSVASDLQTAEHQATMAAQGLAVAGGRLENTQLSVEQLAVRIGENARRIASLEDTRTHQSRQAMGLNVELARSEQQLDYLRLQLRRCEQDREERQRSIGENHQQLADAIARIRDCQWQLLAAESELAVLYLQIEGASREAVERAESRERLRARRHQLSEIVQRQRQHVRRLEERLHQRELAAGQVRHERAAVADRLREDYEVDLSVVIDEGLAGEDRERHVVEEEIVELRRKLTNIGGVNLDALQESEELEIRFAALSQQHEDLSKARATLQQIVGRINADSRRLFAETLENVRGHFQSLFRKLFGGGRADIVLEEGVDLLESGIEIVACPPGKQPRSISLLSGGERTLTCVALLLAVFRSRPSPFCVLDEVDAALDEANIDRFIGVLQEFLTWTQFIVVTHSKRTMTCATTLYGVTMQESGVSKRVSVRFEDVSDDGRIHPAALNDAPSAESALPASRAASADDETQAA